MAKVFAPGMPRRPVHALCLGCLIAATLALTAAPAGAAVSWIVKGRGYGHGVGMSQYGAYGYADAGKGYRWILRHYYRGTSVERLTATRVVRVLLQIDAGDVEFTGARSACGRRLDPGRRYQAHRRANQVRLRSASGRLLARCGGSRLRAAGEGGRVQISGLGPYRGALEVVPTRSFAGSLNAINALSVNQYVKGATSPNEVPYTLALRGASRPGGRRAILRAQRRGHRQRVRPLRRHPQPGLRGGSRWRRRAPAGPPPTRGGRSSGTAARSPRLSSSFSTSGGRTESVENSFYGSAPVPYLKSVVDRYDYHSPL